MENLVVTSEKETIQKYYICPLFDMKEDIKLQGARWCSDVKSEHHFFLRRKNHKLTNFF